MNKPFLSIRDLGVSFSGKSGIFLGNRRFFAIRHVHADIRQMETFCLIGESGSGKTTLVHALLGFHPFHEGAIHFDGQVIHKGSKAAHRKLRERSQLIFQDPTTSLNPFFTIRTSMEEPLKTKGVGKRERREIIEKLADETGLSHGLLSRKPTEISGGQAQRACIVRALSTRPDILFLDEPLTALDAAIQKKVAGLLFRIRENHDMTFFLVTHDLGLVKRIGTTVAVMYLGRIVEKAPVDLFFRDPLHMYSKALLSGSLAPEFRNQKRIILEGDIPSVLSPPSGCVFHPRCFNRLDICAIDPPKPKVMDDGREVFCHWY